MELETSGPRRGVTGKLRTGLLVMAAVLGVSSAAAVFPSTVDDGKPARGGAVAGIATPGSAGGPGPAPGERPAQERSRPRFALQPSPNRLPVDHSFGEQPRAGLLFDVRSGKVLWERHPNRELPIASLTKMLTALLIARGHTPDEKVKISGAAVRRGGSKVGVLPKGEKVRLEALLKALLLVSGNDAAIALAEHDAGSVPAFVAKMNRVARRMGLRCSRFSSPDGLWDRGNHSCARDLATLARAMLAHERIARIARADRQRFPFPVEGGFLDLYNNNPFIRAGAEGITGLKTGYTQAAGRCYVTTAKRGGRHLGVVLLDSPDPMKQVPKLLDLAEKESRSKG